MKSKIMTIGGMLAALVLGVLVVQQPTRLTNKASELSTFSIMEEQNSCPNVLWECSIPDSIHQKFKTDGIDYRLMVTFENSARVERGVLNFPRVTFKPDNALNFTCRIDVVSKTGDLLTCDSSSGRQTCNSPQKITKSCTQIIRDFNNDGTVSTIDAGIFMQKYLSQNIEADLNCDGTLDKRDWDTMRTSAFGSQ